MTYIVFTRDIKSRKNEIILLIKNKNRQGRKKKFKEKYGIKKMGKVL